MNFREHLKEDRSVRMSAVPFLNVGLLLGCILIFAPYLTHKPLVDVKMPRAVTSDISSGDLIITLTGENILYVGGRVVSPQELKSLLGNPRNRERVLLIKADSRSSVGKLIDLWDVARACGVERINLTSGQEM